MFESKLPDVGTTIFSVMSVLANKEKAINLSQGFPNFKTDPRLKSLVEEALEKEEVQYAPMPGRLDLREQIAGKLFVQHGIQVDPASEITVTAGATEAIYSIIAAVISTGDEVILFDPSYDCYAPSVILNGGQPIHLKLTFPDFKIDWDQVVQAISPKTKMIIVNNPHNPSGSTWTKEDLKALESICEKHSELVVLSDEVYEHINFNGDHQTVLKSPLLRERSFAVYSFGKTFHVTGWKIGYCVAPERYMSEMRKVHQFNVFCVNNTMQYALSKYLESGNTWNQVLPLYQSKRDLFLKGMEKSKFKPLKCDGTYFCLFDYSAISDLDDEAFAIWMTKKHKVASIPVSVFYSDKTDNKVIRFCFAKEDQTLTQAIENLCKI